MIGENLKPTIKISHLRVTPECDQNVHLCTDAQTLPRSKVKERRRMPNRKADHCLQQQMLLQTA